MLAPMKNINAKMRYLLIAAAARDLSDIREEGRKQFGLPRSDAYIAGLLQELGRARSEINPPVRVHPHRSPVILYKFDDNRLPLILRIRHAHEAWCDPAH